MWNLPLYPYFLSPGTSFKTGIDRNGKFGWGTYAYLIASSKYVPLA
ncbi:protein of unknown function [Candidatus Nitrosocosmicus franklandus]|uniref:Uncharacterized protein n=1 Tax=Candidatus Nitrosocosmicus franklandianus TaxID=1798806 RepID=A0A484I9M8_9ARCH|nr:protein of unknown function [Candidatus Nitrosocosmicus franklandus]